MIIKRGELYEILRSQLNGEYSIGLHGITGNGPSWYGENSDTENKRIEVYNVQQEILKNGLKIYSDRTINGTVAFFGRIDDAKNAEHLNHDGLLNYNYGGRAIVIVAIPTIIRDENGRSLYLGDTNLNSEYKSDMGSKGYETTTLRDEIFSKKLIPKEYILGTYKLLDNGMIDLFINRNHMSFRGNVVDEKTFNEFEKQLKGFLTVQIVWQLQGIIDTKSVTNYNDLDRHSLEKLYIDLRNAYKDRLVPDGTRDAMAAFLETLKQCLNEGQNTLNQKEEKLKALEKEEQMLDNAIRQMEGQEKQDI